jgi:putative restriction endonuclease
MMLTMPRFFGHVAGHPEGSTYAKRRELHDAGVHRPLRAGISGSASEGADSIVVSGGYSDDEDYGDVIIYTGHGKRDPSTHRQFEDQEITAPGNAGLQRSQLDGLPVRVIRGERASSYAPDSGYRYDGLYRVDSHAAKKGQHGFRIWRFTLIKLEESDISEAPAPPTQSSRRRAPRPRRITTTTIQRIVRNTGVVRQVKEWYKHHCQICGDTIEIGEGRYSEGAHIKGLGRPHEGPDVEANVLCLCPNDHVKFDNGAIYLSDELDIIDAQTKRVIRPLDIHPDHRIDVNYVAHHRTQWTTGTDS